MNINAWVVLIVVWTYHVQVESQFRMKEKQMHKDLLTDYNADVRPEPGHDKGVHIHFDNKLQKLVKLDVKKQIFVLNAFIMMRWTDPQLAWNLSKYDGISTLNLGSKLIWTPDLLLYNTGHEESFDHHDLYKTKAVVNYTGEIVWTAPVTWRVSCEFDVTWFPLDLQICNMTFGSWSYTESQLEISPWYENLDKNSFQESAFMVQSGEWVIDHFVMSTNAVKYPCCHEPFSTITYEIHMKRMSLYYFLYIILPLVSQVFLFLMIFHIPCDTGERMGFGVTILLSITVYLLVISEKLPEKSDNRPMLGICFIAEFYVLCTALALGAVTTNLYKRKSKPSEILVRFMRCMNSSFSLLSCFRKKFLSKPVELKPIFKTNGSATIEDDNEQHINVDPTTNDDNNDDDDDEYDDDDDDNASFTSTQRRNNFLWRKISKAMDRMLFYLFACIVLMIPIIVVSILDRSHLGI